MIILDIPTMIRIFGELDDRRKKLIAEVREIEQEMIKVHNTISDMADKIVEKESKKYEK